MKSRMLHIAIIAGLTIQLPAIAQDQLGTQTNRFLSNTGNLLYLGLGLARPLFKGQNGRNQALRTADALVTSVAVAEGIKLVTREKRPDGSGDRDSFPSGHTTAAFAVATMEAFYHPHEAAYWYLGAGLIAESRVGLHRHYLHDVLAGAVLGYGIARFELSRPQGLILSPWISSDTRSLGLLFRERF